MLSMQLTSLEVKKNSTAINWIKAIAILSVVFYHAVEQYIGLLDSPSIVIKTFSTLLKTMGVPAFFFISGFLCHKQNTIRYYKKKVVKIYIPFLFFSGLKMLYSNVISAEFSVGTSLSEQIKYYLLNGNQYWFIYAVMICFLVAPLFWKMNKPQRSALWSLVVLNVVYVLVREKMTFKFTDFLQLQNFSRYFFLFLLGMLCKYYWESISTFLIKNKNKVLIVGGVLIVGCTIAFGLNQTGDAIRHVCSLSILIMMYYMFDRRRTNRFVELLSRYSLQIMFLDSFVRNVVFALLMRFIGTDFAVTLITATIVPIVSVVVCIIVNKIPILNFAFGIARN